MRLRWPHNVCVQQENDQIQFPMDSEWCVVENVSISGPWKQHQVNGDYYRFKFNVFIGDFVTVFAIPHFYNRRTVFFVQFTHMVATVNANKTNFRVFRLCRADTHRFGRVSPVNFINLAWIGSCRCVEMLKIEIKIHKQQTQHRMCFDSPWMR